MGLGQLASIIGGRRRRRSRRRKSRKTARKRRKPRKTVRKRRKSRKTKRRRRKNKYQRGGIKRCKRNERLIKDSPYGKLNPDQHYCTQVCNPGRHKRLGICVDD